MKKKTIFVPENDFRIIVLFQMQKEEVIRGEIIEIAGKLFQQYGFQKTTMEDIAKAAGKGKSTLYYYYANKNEVFEAVVSAEIEEVGNVVRKGIEAAGSPREKFKVYVAINFIEIRKKTILYNLVCGEMKSNLTSLMYSLRDKFDSAELSMFKDILLEGIQSGDFKSITIEDVDTIAHVILSSLRGIEIDLFIENKIPGFEERLDLVTDLLIRGLE